MPKWRFANARPEPDLRYFSKCAATRSSGNSNDTTIDQGRCCSVYPTRPGVVPLESFVDVGGPAYIVS
jgi:hypothetical protein